MVEIQNAEVLTRLFGHWPDFHDAEIFGVRIDNAEWSEPSIEIDFEVAEMSDEVDERGYFRDQQRARTTLRFERAASLRLEGVYSQNSVFHLALEPAAPEDFDEVLGASEPSARRRHRVRWSAHIGMADSFLCDEIRVIKAETFTRLSHER